MNKFFKSGLTSVVVAGTLFTGFPGNFGGSATVDHALKVKAQTQSHSSLDLALVNDEKLIALLIKQGKVAANASDATKQKALKDYIALKGKELGSDQQNDPLAAKVKAADADKHNTFNAFTENHNNGKLQGSKTHPNPVSESPSPGVVKSGKLLTLMVEYSDLPHNNIKPNETDNYYPDYTPQHYEDMIFGGMG
ncbi:immune inhibitor A [Neobacillus sp. PS3-34]|uniref:immune inhibitor A domain-containing protein n=1 Tax=Neobacillus sp. PS3-34 TaxID=3070678 RepID=UPI0027E010AD|nr:immune inhibitor A domain-containing protein [Neobacillus sp. PS3-34]WML46661.1 immune inhibitor A [Neobacillus sp. PS3-34]